MNTNTDGLVAPVTCSRCKGKGHLPGVSYAGGVCAKCGGAGVVEGDRATLADAKARSEFLAWAVEQGERRERSARKAWAAHAVRHLAATDPARYDRALASWKAGRADLYPALIALAEEAAR